MMELSDYVIKFLGSNGVKDAFVLAGGGSMYLIDSLGRSRKIKYTCHQHEQSCAMAAEAYAKYSNTACMVIVTGGPGVTNALTGVAGAYLDSVPCIFISGQAKRKQTVHNEKGAKLRQFGTQEIDVIPIVEPLCKYAVMVNEPDMIRYHLEKAFYLAKNGRPGPVWLDIPIDVQSASIDEARLVKFDPSELEEKYKTKPAAQEISYITSLIRKAKRPVIIAGHGIRLAGAIQAFGDFIKKTGIPVVTPFLGIDVIRTDDDNFAGRIGLQGTRAGNFALQNADLVISIGSRLSVPAIGHDYSSFAGGAKKVVIDVDPEEHKKSTIKIDKFINSDALQFIKALSKALGASKTGKFEPWAKRCRQWKKKYPVFLPKYRYSKDGVNIYYLMEQLNNLNNKRSPVVTDSGSSFYAVAQSIFIGKEQRYITSGALATMGFSLPAGIGACIASGGKDVIVITGDGSFQQNIQELQTIVHYGLPVKMFIISNSCYLSIRQTQEKFFKAQFVGEGPGSGITFPSIKKIAAAYGIKYVQISPANVPAGIKRTLREKGPVICEVMALKDQEIAPRNTSEMDSDGIIVSKPLEDMYPFLPREEFLKNMIVEQDNK